MKRMGVVRGPLLLLVAALAGGAAPLDAVTAQEAPAAVESTESKEPAPTSGSDAGAAAPTTTAPAADATGLSEKEKALLQRINALKAPRWRPFGACRYDWAGWKLMADGVRTTAVQCGPETAANTSAGMPASSVAVHCDTLKLSVRSGDQAWSSWRLPYAASESKERGGEDLMVASLCANAKPIPRAQPAAPPAVNPAAKPAATPQKKPATAAPVKKPAATKP